MDNYRDRLIPLLDKAIALASQYSGGYCSQFLSAEEFHAALVANVDRFKQGDESQLWQMASWFAPTCCWDDFVGVEGADLANEICEILYPVVNKRQY